MWQKCSTLPVQNGNISFLLNVDKIISRIRGLANPHKTVIKQFEMLKWSSIFILNDSQRYISHYIFVLIYLLCSNFIKIFNKITGQICFRMQKKQPEYLYCFNLLTGNWMNITLRICCSDIISFSLNHLLLVFFIKHNVVNRFTDNSV